MLGLNFFMRLMYSKPEILELFHRCGPPFFLDFLSMLSSFKEAWIALCLLIEQGFQTACEMSAIKRPAKDNVIPGLTPQDIQSMRGTYNSAPTPQLLEFALGQDGTVRAKWSAKTRPSRSV